MRVLITGGSGFIGSHLTDHFLAQGDSVRIVDDLSTGAARNLQHHHEHPNLQIIHADLGDPNLVADVCQDVDQV